VVQYKALDLKVKLSLDTLANTAFSTHTKYGLSPELLRNISLLYDRSLGRNEERVVNAFETWCWRRMLKIKWTDRIANDEVFQRAKEERLLL